jgi:disulfide bond formation protein DsbB
MKDFIKRNALYGAFAMSLMATVGSLFYSEILKLPPCVLCWYQRIAMYPLILIFGFAIYRKSREVLWPAFIMVPIGWLIAVYHNLLYFNILPEAAAPCVAGISCTSRMPGLLGTVPIPLQALVGFSILLILLIIIWRTSSNSNGETQNND